MNTIKQSIVNPNWWDVGVILPDGSFYAITCGLSFEQAVSLCGQLNGSGR